VSRMKWRLSGGTGAVTLLGVVLTIGCSEPPLGSVKVDSGLDGIVVVSDPLGAAATAPALSASPGSPLAVSVAYVSIPQGALPEGIDITIRNPRTGQTFTAPLVDGGLDPVPIGAEAGDSLEIVVTVSNGAPLRAVVVVPAHRPPVVVRTSPPPRKTGVPLNAVVIAVFSEPLDSSSVTGHTVTLTRVRDDALVAGSPRTSSATAFQIDWQADSLLEPSTEYRLEARGVRDISGDVLQAPAIVTFTTGSTLAAVPLRNVVAVAAGYDHSCALDSIGRAYCWGDGLWGQLGRGTRDADAFAEPVLTDLPLREIVVGENFSCGLTVGGAALCWGLNWFGQVGLSQQDSPSCVHPAGGRLACSLVPVPVSVSEPFTSLAAGAAHVCGLTSGRSVYCWGDNVSGQLGADDTGERCDQYYTQQQSCSSRPLRVQGGVSFQTLTAGKWHTCGLTVAGDVYCWGLNSNGQLGSGDTAQSAVPKQVAAGGVHFSTISAGGWHTCGLAYDGLTYCWGANGSGQLGVGDFNARFTPMPVAVVGRSLTTVRAGVPWTAALGEDGSLYVFGYGSAVPFALPARFSSVAPGESHMCAVASGRAYCWGDNQVGELGNGEIWHWESPSPPFTWTPQRVVTRP
jgi:alpha-tubulin suppressor-like RCC1 family protein